MIRCVLITSIEPLATAYSQYLIDSGQYVAEDLAVRTVADSAVASWKDCIPAFHMMRAWLTEQLEAAGPIISATGLPVFTDLHHGHALDLAQLDPLRPGHGLQRLLGMLILAFPEMHWIFVGTRQEGLVSREFWGRAHLPVEDISSSRGHCLPSTVAGLAVGGYFPLFDGTGLRSALRATINGFRPRSSALLPTRTSFATALDDEPQYAVFHSYVAFRFGFRALPIHTFALAQLLLGPLATRQGEQSPLPDLIFEDVFLDLPDGGTRLSRLWLRALLLPVLDVIRHRVFVTSGQRQRGDSPKLARNLAYLRGQRSAGQHIAVIQKPRAGMFAIWKESRLDRRLNSVDAHGRTRGLGHLYRWPPFRRAGNQPDQPHSAPGILEVIATSLVERAERVREQQIATFEDALRGAVLATEALELLGGRAPTTSIDALALKHEFEVQAECRFAGAEYQLDLIPRFTEIERDVAVIARAFASSERYAAALNADIRIVSGLLRIFRENAQFEEEQACVNRVRHLRNSLWLRQRRRRLLVWPFIRYVEIMLSSFTRFLLVIACWIVLLTVLYRVTGPPGLTTAGALEDSLSSFFSIGNPVHGSGNDLPSPYIFVICFAIVSGFAHLGLFVSHLYSLVARK